MIRRTTPIAPLHQPSPLRRGSIPLAALLLAGAAQLPAATAIVKDDFESGGDATTDVLFTENTGTAMVAGRAPAITNLPGGVWQWTIHWYDAQSITAWTWNDTGSGFGISTAASGGGAAITLASSGAYTRPAKLRISAKLSFYNEPETATDSVLWLGFWDGLQGAAKFTGLQLDYAGSLTLVEHGTFTGATRSGADGSTISFTGTYNPLTYTTLSYQIDTSSGTISDVHLEGSSSAYAFSTTAFSVPATAYAGFYGYNFPKSARFDDFLVEDATGTEPSAPPKQPPSTPRIAP